MSLVNKEEHLRLLQRDFLSRFNVMCSRGDKRELSRMMEAERVRMRAITEREREEDEIRQSSLISVC